MSGSKHPTLELAKRLIQGTPEKVVSPRFIYHSITWTPREIIPTDFAMLGFNHRSKMTQLKRNYWNPEVAKKVMDRVRGRKNLAFTSMAVPMRGADKDPRSQGWCMDAMVISVFGTNRLKVSVSYRSTEVLQKFAADQTFLLWVFEELGIKPTQVSFYLSNGYVSGVFMPTIFMFEEPEPFLEWANKKARPWLELTAPYFWKRYHNPDIIPSYSPARKQHRMAWTKIPSRMKQALSWIKKHELLP